MSLLFILFLNVSFASEAIPLFDGETLSGWQAQEQGMWRVENGAIIGGSLSNMIEKQSYLVFTQPFQNFDLRLKILLQGDEGFINSGIPVRSIRLPGSHEMSGYQVDIGDAQWNSDGASWWGQIYDNKRRNKFIAKAMNGAQLLAAINKGDWNEIRIRCEGPRIRTWVNNVPVADYTETEDDIAQHGHIGIQVHGGGKSLVQVKEIFLTELPNTTGGLTWDQTGVFMENDGVRWNLQRDN